MNQIKVLRNQLDEVQKEILELILKRSQIVEHIWKEKKRLGLQFDDSQREDSVIHQFDSHPLLNQDENLQSMYHNIVKSIIFENKKYISQKLAK